MAPFALVLVIAAAGIHASWNLLAKRAAPAGPAFVFAYNLVACVAYAPWVLWLVASGAVAWSWAVAAVMLASGLVHLAYSLVLQRGYQVADLSVVYPVARGTGPMIAAIGAFVALGEAPGPERLAGLAAVVAGILLISTNGRFSAFRGAEGRAGVTWGLATGALIACYTLIDAYAVKELRLHPVVLDWASNLLRFAALAPLVAMNPEQAKSRLQGRWRLAIWVGLLSPLSYILVLAALRMGAAVSVVAPARELSMMIGALLGMYVLREPVGRWRLAGCAAMILGVVLLGAS